MFDLADVLETIQSAANGIDSTAHREIQVHARLHAIRVDVTFSRKSRVGTEWDHAEHLRGTNAIQMRAAAMLKDKYIVTMQDSAYSRGTTKNLDKVLSRHVCSFHLRLEERGTDHAECQ